jgi:deazaflavin-dependent oxidoreductase (nitroreductase family)
MVDDEFGRLLQGRRQISIKVIGRRTGQTITLPVWFVTQEDALYLLPVRGSETQWYRNMLANPSMTIQMGKQRETFRATALRGTQSVRRVIQWFRDKYTPEVIARLYPGPLNVAVKIRYGRR